MSVNDPAVFNGSKLFAGVCYILKTKYIYIYISFLPLCLRTLRVCACITQSKNSRMDSTKSYLLDESLKAHTCEDRKVFRSRSKMASLRKGSKDSSSKSVSRCADLA